MTARSRLVRTACLAAIALLAGPGCQPAPRASLRTAAAPPPAAVAATGLVRVDLSAIAAAWSPRRLLTNPPLIGLGDVLKVKLVVRGQGMTAVSSEAVAIDAAVPGADMLLSLAVPAGHNRVFEVQGLNGDGQVCKHLSGLASVTTGQDVTVTVDALSDAAARVVDVMLTDAKLGAPEVRALAAGDLRDKLMAYIDLYTLRNGLLNEYQGLNPVYFRAHALASTLRVSGITVLDNGVVEALNASAASDQLVVVRDTANAYVPNATVTLLATYPQLLPKGNAKAEYAFNRVPPGRWAVAVSYGGKVTYGSLEAVDFAPGVPPSPVTIVVPTPPPVVPATVPRVLYGPTTLLADVTGTTLAGATLSTVLNGAGGSKDPSLSIVAAAGSEAELQLTDTGNANYSAYSFLRFRGRAITAGVPLLVRLTRDGNAFGTSFELPAGGLSSSPTWQEFKIPLNLLSANLAELATANGVRFTTFSPNADFRLDDIQLEGM